MNPSQSSGHQRDPSGPTLHPGVDAIVAEMDLALQERAGAAIKPASEQGVLAMLDTLHKPMEGNVLELINEMARRGYELSYKVLVPKDQSDPSIIVTAIHQESGRFGIPNANFLDEIAPELENGEKLNPNSKQLMGGAEEEPSEDGALSAFTVEEFSPDCPCRFVISSPSVVDKAFDLNVQYSTPAFENSFHKLPHYLDGSESDYCHLYHEVVLGALRSFLYEQSAGVFGLHEKPQIDHRLSGITKDGSVVITAFCPRPYGSEQDSWPEFRFGLLKDDQFSPYPFTFKPFSE